MATVVVPLFPGPVERPTTNAPQPKYIAGSTTSRRVLAFDAATEETCFFVFRAARYASGNLTVRVRWSAASATSGVVQFGAAVGAITPDTDSTSLGSKVFGTAATVTDTHLGTNADRVMTTAVTVTSLDSIAADDHCFLKFYRDADDAADTMTGDCYVEAIDLEYSDV
jgi:hypothetical protein